MSRPVVIGALAERDIREKETVSRIAANPELYRPIFGDARRAPVKSYKFSVWYRVAPDQSIVIACLSDRRDLSLARRRVMRPVEPM